MNTANIPLELRQLPQWVCWRWERRDGKLTKPPYQPDGTLADSTAPATWYSFAEVVAAYEQGGFDGIGFVLTADAGYCAWDLDHCRDVQTGEITPWATGIVTSLRTYTEVTPSGTGLRVIGKATLPLDGKGRKKGNIESYQQARYITVTGHHLEGTPATIEDRQAEVNAVYEQVFGRPQEEKPEPKPQTAPPISEDADLIEKAQAAKNGAAFSLLWDGDCSAYPSQSEADLALCSHLAYWTDGDASRIDVLFRQSALYRPKWDEKHGATTYGQLTIAKALEGATMSPLPDVVLSPGHTEAIAAPQNGASPALVLTPLGDLLSEPEEAVAWLWDGTLPSGGLSILAAKPKVGKSTLARNLALAVARGDAFLGRATTQGGVVYLALEEKRSQVKGHFTRMGASGDEPVAIHVGSAPEKALPALAEAIKSHGAILAIVDPLLKLVRLRDANDYAEVVRALEPLLKLARDSGCHIMCVHHLGKVDREGADGILGSTGLFAAVDTALIMKRRDDARTLESTQRYGEDIPRTVLAFDKDTGCVAASGTVAELELERMEGNILDTLGGDELTEKAIRESIGGNTGLVSKALRQLVAKGKVDRLGEGGKKDPYRYRSFVVSCFPYIEKTTKQQKQEPLLSASRDVMEV